MQVETKLGFELPQDKTIKVTLRCPRLQNKSIKLNYTKTTLTRNKIQYVLTRNKIQYVLSITNCGVTILVSKSCFCHIEARVFKYLAQPKFDPFNSRVKAPQL